MHKMLFREGLVSTVMGLYDYILHRKSMEWFLYDGDLRHEKVELFFYKYETLLCHEFS